MSTPQQQCHEEECHQQEFHLEECHEEECHEEEIEYTIDIKLNIPICLEPRVFTKGLSVHTSQKVKIRIQPDIQLIPDVSSVAPNCTFQTNPNQPQPEIIFEGILEQA